MFLSGWMGMGREKDAWPFLGNGKEGLHFAARDAGEEHVLPFPNL